jgi:branched-chain amino acid transport system substrate-binding protein
MAACHAAQGEINAAGGIRGRKLGCVSADSGSDAADAVPAAEKMIATTSNLVAILGPNEVAPATEPLFRRQKVVMLSLNGDPRYDHNSDPYFFRLTPADDVGGVAMAEWAIHGGLKHAAFVFDNDIGAQTSVPALTYAYKRLGGTIASSPTLAPDQPSYKSEIEGLLASHPDAIITETDPQTASTFFAEYLQLSGGHLVPIQTDSAGLLNVYENALAKSIGKANTQRYFSGTSIASPAPKGPAYAAFKAALLKAAGPSAAQYASVPFVASPYDSFIAAALAMTAAHSFTPAVYRAYMAKVTGQPRVGTVTVHTYAAGVAALKSGRQIVYVGANGPLVFNRYQNVAGAFAVFRDDPANPTATPVYVIPAATVAGLIKP